MKQIGSILVALDGSFEGGPALAKAGRLAASAGARLVLFLCDFDQAMEGSHFLHTEHLDRARADHLAERRTRLEAMAAPLREQGLDVDVEAVYENPLHEALLAAAVRWHPDLVIMATHHHAWLEKATLTATDWQLIRTCPCPLLLVKERPWSAPYRVAAAVDPGHSHDEPAALDHAILAALEALTALEEGSEGWAVHASPELGALAYSAAMASVPAAIGSTVEDFSQDLMRIRRRAVMRLVEGHDIGPEHVQIREGRPEHELPAFAAEEELDVLVIGAVSRTRLERVFVGGTAERVLDRMPCDLLVIKPPGFGAAAS